MQTETQPEKIIDRVRIQLNKDANVSWTEIKPRFKPVEYESAKRQLKAERARRNQENFHQSHKSRQEGGRETSPFLPCGLSPSPSPSCLGLCVDSCPEIILSPPSVLASHLVMNAFVPREIWVRSIHEFGETWGRLYAYFVCRSGYLKIPQEVLAACHPYGFGRLKSGQKMNVKDLGSEIFKRLDAERPFNLIFDDYEREEKPRTVISYGVSLEVEEWTKLHADDLDLVNVFTGEPHNGPTRAEADVHSVPVLERLRTALNAQNLDYPSLVNDSLKQTRASQLITAVDSTIEQNRQRSMLRFLKHHPNPIYSGSPHSARFNIKNASLGSLNRKLRQSFFEDYISFDLKNAQLSIISKIWDAPEVISYFDGRPIWSTLQTQTSLSKDTLKKGVYTIVFGGRMVSAVQNMAEVEGISSSKTWQKIRNCRFFTILEQASERHSKRIRSEKSCLDAFGRELLTKAEIDAFPERAVVQGKRMRHIKACQVQSYEIAIMEPILTEVLELKKPVWLFLHDGFITDKSIDVYGQSLKGLAKGIAWGYGIDIELEMETIKSEDNT